MKCALTSMKYVYLNSAQRQFPTDFPISGENQIKTTAGTTKQNQTKLQIWQSTHGKAIRKREGNKREGDRLWYLVRTTRRYAVYMFNVFNSLVISLLI